jgi:biotin carboxyl carrier protein
MKTFQVTVNGKKYMVEVEEITDKGSDKAEKVVLSEQEKPATGGMCNLPDGNLVKAPLGGVILSVKVNQGDNVKVGDLLLTLEAMKMENEIISPYTGKVKAVYVTEGTSVNAGDVLVVIG